MICHKTDKIYSTCFVLDVRESVSIVPLTSILKKGGGWNHEQSQQLIPWKIKIHVV